MKKINAIIVSVTMLVAGLNFYFANCDAQSDFDLSMADVEQVAQGELDPRLGRTQKREDPDFIYCPTCGWDWLVCITRGRSECTPITCLHIDPAYN